MDSEFWHPFESYISSFPFVIDQPKSINWPTCHHTPTSWSSPQRHEPHDHMGRFWITNDIIPKTFMGNSCLGDICFWIRFYCMGYIHEFHSICKDKDRKLQR